MNKSADHFFVGGCGRCSYADTPKCKVNTFREELQLLRSILLDSELTEDCKWGVPCYTVNNKNVILLSAFKEFCSISFLKGALFKDPDQLLIKPGENSQSARYLKFQSTNQITKIRKQIKALIKESIEIEKSGKKLEPKEKAELVFPEELLNIFKTNKEFKNAFFALTPGRQRGYNMFFTAAKQSATKVNRINKCMPDIFKGKGLNEY
ncbi:MAG: YdeI/OmpD-associated family protein [bacterium]|jgi:uncharacterized protein YdeI (YjbR/CyaY-like superfamily)